MKNQKYIILSLVLGLIFLKNTSAQLPTAQEIAAKMTIGWNLGNTLEAMGGEIAWGGAITSQALIDKVKSVGFNTVRLPVAWDHHAKDGVIDAAWIARVKEIVDYCMKANMYIILNIHWDGGWLEKNVTTTAQETVNAKQKVYWTQIANYFKNYDEHLLFASANEPDVKDSTEMAILMTYHQTFVDAVRASGGNNSSRVLIIQGPTTDIEKTFKLMKKMPTDKIENRLMAEVHYYTPYQFCLMRKDENWGKMAYYWGKDNHSKTDTTHNAKWGEEKDVEKLFGMMKTQFVDKGIPVILGEFAANKRKLSEPADQQLHNASRAYFYKYVVNSAKEKGIIPICWDCNKQMFDRSTATVLDPEIIDAIFKN